MILGLFAVLEFGEVNANHTHTVREEEFKSKQMHFLTTRKSPILILNQTVNTGNHDHPSIIS